MSNPLVDMSSVEAYLVTGSKERLPFLFATLSSLLSNVCKFKVTIFFNYPETSWFGTPYLALLDGIAKANNNELLFSVNCNDSLPQIKAAFVEQQTRPWIMNLDDDIIYPWFTLDLVSRAVMCNMALAYTFGFYDVLDTRGYFDWDSIERPRSELEDLMAKCGPRVIPSHLWVPTLDLEFIRTDFIGQYVISSDFFRSDKGKEVLGIWKGFEKGVRGYDHVLDSFIKPIYYLYGSRTFHIGVIDSYLNNSWHSVSKYVPKDLVNGLEKEKNENDPKG